MVEDVVPLKLVALQYLRKVLLEVLVPIPKEEEEEELVKLVKMLETEAFVLEEVAMVLLHP